MITSFCLTFPYLYYFTFIFIIVSILRSLSYENCRGREKERGRQNHRKLYFYNLKLYINVHDAVSTLLSLKVKALHGSKIFKKYLL